jgi:hypothetical protein
MSEPDSVLAEIRQELHKKREEWRRLRELKLDRKRVLAAGSLDKKQIRQDAVYRKLEKEQAHLAKVIKHIEKRLNRKMARLNKNAERP